VADSKREPQNVGRCQWRTVVGAALVACALAACARASKASHDDDPVDAGQDANDAKVADAFMRPDFCMRSGEDSLRDTFCGDGDVTIKGVADLVSLLSLDATPRGGTLSPGGGTFAVSADDRAFVVVIGHSTALPGHVVSPINPRALLVGMDTSLAYARGVQRVELASRARDKPGFNFYLVEFEQACNATKSLRATPRERCHRPMLASSTRPRARDWSRI